MNLYIEIRPSKIGVEFANINLAKPADSSIVDTLLDHYNKHHLLIIKNQILNEDQLIEASKIFGEPVPALVPTFRLENFPVITKHTNLLDENNLPTGVIAPEYVYHSDSYFTTNPNKATLLYSLKSPKRGGETNFVDMCRVYDSLDESTKTLISEKKVIYKNAYINQPPVIHPMIRVHPITKKRALFVNIHRALGIENMENKAAVELIEYLYNYSTKSEFVYKHIWNDGDLLVWNNPTTMHCATKTENGEERLLYRILTLGATPVC